MKRNSVTAILLTILLPFFGVCCYAAHEQSAAPVTLGVNARIHITVVDYPDRCGDYVIDPNGDITMLYVNQLHVAGLTLTQAADKIARTISSSWHYGPPHVEVTLLEPSGLSVYIGGAVSKAKACRLPFGTHLSDVMALVKTTQGADLTKVGISTGHAGRPRVIVYDYLLYQTDKDPAGDPLLHDGDNIYVPLK